MLLTKDNKVFKRFNEPDIYESYIAKLARIKNESFVFPQSPVVFKDTIIEYIMEYVEGVHIKYLSKDISFKFLEIALRYMHVKDISDMSIVDFSNKLKLLYKTRE